MGISTAAPLLLAGMILLGATFSQSVFAHTFSGDESASFLALVESMRVEVQLAQSNFAANKTLAEEHAAHAHEHLDNDTIDEISERNERLGRDLPAAIENLHFSIDNSTQAQIDAKVQNINDLLGETVTVRIDGEQLSNSTVQALLIANLADGIVEHYKAAYGIEAGGEHGHEEGNETHDEGSMTMEEEGTTHNESMAAGTNGTMGGNTTEHKEIVSMAQYQSAQALANRTLQVFEEQVKGLAPANSTEMVADFEASMQHLIDAIDNREQPADVEVILHGEVHPSLQRAYNLQVIPEFPLPLLMTIPAIAGVIAAARLKRK